MFRERYQLVCGVGFLVNMGFGTALVFGPPRNHSVGVISGCLAALWFNFAGFGDKRWNTKRGKDEPTAGMGLAIFAAIAYGIAAVIVALYPTPVLSRWFAVTVLIAASGFSAATACYFRGVQLNKLESPIFGTNEDS